VENCVALIVAAGRGQRLGGEVPKQYRLLGGRAMLRHSVLTFLHNPRVNAVRAIIHPADQPLYEQAVAGLSLLPPIYGGAARQESARLGLESLAALEPGLVLIHDAARPFVDFGTIDRVIDALDETPAAIAAVPVIDTLKRENGGLVEGTLDRAALWRAQTPQGFRFHEIIAAHRAAIGRELTDDAAVAEHAGLPVRLVLGSEENFKVTTEEDLRRAERFAIDALCESRVGTGFDVHQFGPGDKLMLCGLPVAHDHGLVGHSDGDVGLHALTDALLGCIGAGDIGSHFPPSDPRWKGAASALFLRHAADLVAERGGSIVNLDVTVICERPKIGPHREAMAARIAEILGIPRERVSVKATTTDKLGFTGRGEGIAAQAVATIRLPSRP